MYLISILPSSLAHFLYLTIISTFSLTNHIFVLFLSLSYYSCLIIISIPVIDLSLSAMLFFLSYHDYFMYRSTNEIYESVEFKPIKAIYHSIIFGFIPSLLSWRRWFRSFIVSLQANSLEYHGDLSDINNLTLKNTEICIKIWFQISITNSALKKIWDLRNMNQRRTAFIL